PVQAEPIPSSPSRPGRKLVPVAVLLLLLVAAGFAGQRWVASLSDRETDSPYAVVPVEGTPTANPAQIRTASPRPSDVVNPTPTPIAIPEPTAAATAEPRSETPVPETPAPATPAPEPPPETPAAVAVLEPQDSVTRFYSLVSAGRFDEAYGLWSDRMRASYPRQVNLDDRFAQTASVTVHRLALVANDGRRAVVAIDFTETYDTGSWRRFDGSWELVNVGGGWLLDVPHF
ncbi:MAG TPA: hypothetical protein VHK28_01305, partial [Candidatus Limnocylindria bacterium]|nr:hypothetical protein [Candidatus Limnocylindria bacterium]